MNKKYEKFLSERIKLGETSYCAAYKWNDKVYKCFNSNYPQKQIDEEVRIQNEIGKSNLNIPKFYKCEFARTIKMDLVNGVTTAKAFEDLGKDKAMKDFMDEFDKVHKVIDLDIGDLNSQLKKGIKNAPVSDEEKNRALEYIKEINRNIKEEKVLCHMEYQFLNALYQKGKIYIVDWTHAKMGKAIYDYARTYVLIYEKKASLKDKYLKEVYKRRNYSQEIFKKAIYVNTIYRLKQSDSKRVRQLLELLEK